MNATLAWVPVGAAALTASVLKLKTRLELSKAKHPSLRGHSRMARRVAAQVPFYEYDDAHFFCSDDAPAEVAARRRAGFMRLAELYRQRFARTVALTKEVEGSISDQQFTSAYRVPFQFRSLVRQHLSAGAFVASSAGVTVTDLDGNDSYDLAGSYGVNVFGYDFYKQCMDAAVARVRELGPVLGAYHPVVAYNVKRLREISGLDEVSFHMSGTEAVMQAVRLARYHTRRSHLVRFCGAYHGWWGDVQPGIGNPSPAHETYTLKDMDEDALRVLRKRKDIACVLVNPLQALHPNASAPGDSTLVDSSRAAHVDREAYRDWLRRLRAVCTEKNIVLILDEVFVGWRPGILRRPRRHGHVRQDAGRGLPGGCRLRPQGSDEAIPRRPADRHLLRARHVQRTPHRDGRHARVSAPDRDARAAGAVRQPRRDLERSGGAAQRAAARRRPARRGREPRLHLDRDVHPAEPLQLDAAVLPPRRGPGPELGRNGALHLQPQLHRRRLRGRRRPLSLRRCN